MAKKGFTAVQGVRVIRDSRDASKDYFLDKAAAQQLYDEGKLVWDVTNRCYSEPPRDQPKPHEKLVKEIRGACYVHRNQCLGKSIDGPWTPRIAWSRTRPPEKLADLMVKRANEYHSVMGAVWKEEPDGSWVLTGKYLPEVGTLLHETVHHHMEGLMEGYKLALGPTKPWFVDVPKYKFVTRTTLGVQLLEVKFNGFVTEYFETEKDMARVVMLTRNAYTSTYERWKMQGWSMTGIPLNLDFEYGFDHDREFHF